MKKKINNVFINNDNQAANNRQQATRNKQQETNNMQNTKSKQEIKRIEEQLKRERREDELDRRQQERENLEYVKDVIWNDFCYGYILDRIVIMTLLFRKKQPELPKLNKENVVVITSYLFKDWMFEKLDLQYELVEDQDLVDEILG